MKKIKLAFGLCGSFCTMSSAIDQMEQLANMDYDILPIMSFNAYSLDTKFGKAQDFIERIESICSKRILKSLTDVEPIGPKNLADIMLICPCTGNTLSKICHAVTDTPITLGVKSHLRVQKPVVIALATNDALGATATNLGRALNTKHLYFVPISQDDCISKPASLVSHFDLIPEALTHALNERQIQPIFR